MSTENKTLVNSFIEEIWNRADFEKLGQFIHPEFIDHSLPPALPANVQGLQQWIIGTGKSFEHHTTIEEMVCEDSKVMLKIRMALKHIGMWRDIAPTGANVSAIGYRYLLLRDQKIIGHWALLDGNAIENQLKEAQHGCKIQE